MSGRRLLDAARLLNAARSIAKQHIRLRSQQLDVYSQTSTVAKAVKSQTDRVTLTLRAAAALARRMNEQSPAYQDATTSPSPKSDSDKARLTPREAALNEEQIIQSDDKRASRQKFQDAEVGEYQRRGTILEDGLSIRQEEAKGIPLPDGTIPLFGAQLRNSGQEVAANEHKLSSDAARIAQRSAEKQIPSVTAVDRHAIPTEDELGQGHDQDLYYHPSTELNREYSSLPRVKIPKHTETIEGQSNEVDESGLNADTFYTPGIRKNATASVRKKDELPEGVDVNVFRTARVSRMLGVDPSQNENHSQRSRQALGANVYETDATEETSKKVIEDLAADLTRDSQRVPDQQSNAASFQMRESRVPSSRLGRLWEYGGLGVSMAFGAVGESLRRAAGGGAGGSLLLSPGNMERLVAKLSRMRGAALKLGQMISFQDLKMLPGPIQDVLQRVQDSADYMPASQRNKVLAANLGSDWRKLFSSFDEVPIAAASIGQVHKAVLSSTGKEVAVKVQYPGVASSIDSDLNNLSVLLTASRLLPKGLYLDKTIANARTELAWECDYIREAECARRFKDLLADETDTFTVPAVVNEASGKEVLTAELMHGVAVTKMKALTQQQRDWVGTQILRLALREICEFRFMQTDPNWTNFLYNATSQKLELLDFGASREYPIDFVEPYIGILRASAVNDRASIRDLSIKLGYLTGAESKTMTNAHIDSVLTLAEPFKEDGPDVYDFRDQTITDRVRELIPLMVRERLAPPPEETYSLHRKLSGAFLLCARLGSQVPCKKLFHDAMKKFDTMIATI